jgi:winged helix-turn-helix DNA-binding protein
MRIAPERVTMSQTVSQGRWRMNDWWAEIDDEILDCLRDRGPMSPAAIGRRIGVSEGAATSILSMLARQGRVRVCLVELTNADGSEAGPARPAAPLG